jgi:hypothetical protein
MNDETLIPSKPFRGYCLLKLLINDPLPSNRERELRIYLDINEEKLAFFTQNQGCTLLKDIVVYMILKNYIPDTRGLDIVTIYIVGGLFYED